MTIRSALVCLLLLSASLLSACAMSAKVLSPTANEELQGGAGFVVKLDSGADASTFNVTLDGTDISSSFNPQPFQAGTTLTAVPPVLYPIDGSNQHYIHASAQWDGASSGPQGMGIDFLATALCLQTPNMAVAKCDTSPPFCTGNVEENRSIRVRVVLNQAPAVNLPVTVTPSNNKLRLNNANAGSPVDMIIPATNDESFVNVWGITPTTSESVQLTFTAAGSEPNFCLIGVYQ